MQVFLAAPFFSEAERDFNAKVARKLRRAGFAVWMAQEAPFLRTSASREKRRIFRGDLAALRRSDAVVAVLDGADIDAGVGFEMGYAHGAGKPIVGLKTDYRTFSPLERVNLMLEMSLRRLCRSVDEVLDALRKLADSGG